jgi:hypothetical protein
LIVFVQTPPRLDFGRCGLISGSRFLKNVELNFMAAGLSRQTTSGQAVVALVVSGNALKQYE